LPWLLLFLHFAVSKIRFIFESHAPHGIKKHDIPVAAHPHETKKHYICRYFHTYLIQ